MQVLRNAMWCSKCRKIVESKSRHDFETCDCGNFTDGGLDYVRQGGDLENTHDISKYKKDDGDIVDRGIELARSNVLFACDWLVYLTGGRDGS